jgi:hypothetical protein
VTPPRFIDALRVPLTASVGRLEAMEEFVQFFAQYQDHLAPKLDVYEQAIYLYIVRQTLAEGKREETIGFKSARRKMGFGVGKAGTPPSERIVYEKLRSLESKGCIKALGSERSGTRIRVVVPSEIPGLVPVASEAASVPLEQIDFFSVPENRSLILAREGWRCFYCLAKLTFEEAASVFLDPSALTFWDPDHSDEEDREITIGRSGRQRVLFVAHAPAGRPSENHQRAEGFAQGAETI